MIRKGQASQCVPGGMAILVHCFHSWSVRCDSAKFPIMYRDLRLHYKLATLAIELAVSSLVKAIRACVRSLSPPWRARPESLFSYGHPQVQAAYKTGWGNEKTGKLKPSIYVLRSPREA
jgi:hypothetical protein